MPFFRGRDIRAVRADFCLTASEELAPNNRRTARRSRLLLTSALIAPASVVAGAALALFASTPLQATMLGCSVSGTTTLQTCSPTSVSVTMTPGTGSLTVEDVTTISVIYASPQTAGTYDQTVNILGATHITNPAYSGLVMQFGTDSSTPPQRNGVVVNATVTVGPDVVASSGPSGGYGTIWVLNDNAGNIAIDNAGRDHPAGPEQQHGGHQRCYQSRRSDHHQ